MVTLISDGEVVATYTYDSFGNILEQTGEVDNSILYAGYQYDEETGLYYINARMYDPVTARFLQADTYLGATNDPLSLNLYTYCLNNPHKYVDPSGHFAILPWLIHLGVTALAGWMGGKAEYDRQIAEGDNYVNKLSVFFVGAANAGIAFWFFGTGQGAALAGTGVKAVFKHVAKAVVQDTFIGALADAGIETTRQLITGTGITNLEYDRITEAGIYGGIAGGVSTLAGAGLQGLMNTRVAQSAIKKLDTLAHKGAKAIKNGFERIAKKNGKATTKAITGLGESRFRMNLQFFASDEVYQGGSKIYANSSDITKEMRMSKPLNSPDIDIWYEKKGTISIDKNDIWTYHDWEGNSVSYAGGYPDFKSAGMVRQEALIGQFVDRNKDFARARELGYIKSPDGTWHHHEDGMTLQEVETILHNRFRHRGGISNLKRK